MRPGPVPEFSLVVPGRLCVACARSGFISKNLPRIGGPYFEPMKCNRLEKCMSQRNPVTNHSKSDSARIPKWSVVAVLFEDKDVMRTKFR